MFDHIPLNKTVDELLREYRRCGDPVIELLCEKLEGANEELDELRAENAKLQHEVMNPEPEDA